MRYQKPDLMTEDLLYKARKMGLGIRKGDYQTAMQVQLDSKLVLSQFGTHLMDYILAEEDYWMRRTPRRVIFPADGAMLHRLLSDDFQLTDPVGFELPFDSFMLAMPKGFEHDGVVLPSCLVTWVDATEHVSRVVNGFLDSYGHPPARIRLMQENLAERALAIVLPARDGSYSRIMCYRKRIPSLLATKSLEEYRALVGDLSDETIAADLDEYDSKQQYLILKLVASVGVYTAACGIQGGLTEGIRNPAERTAFLPKIVKTIAPFTLSDVDYDAGGDVLDQRSLFVQLESPAAEEGQGAGEAPAQSGWIFARKRALPYQNSE